MSAIQGDHVQPSTHSVVTYRVQLVHGGKETVYKAWVSLLDGRWHQIEAGTVEGEKASETTPLIVARVLSRIDQLDFEKLNKG
jgi:hypothetical protein